MRFHKYFRISRERFDEIYKAAALSGLFGLHPPEPMYSEVHPEGPGRPGHHQDDKKIPLCLMIGAVMRREGIPFLLSFGIVYELFSSSLLARHMSSIYINIYVYICMY